MRPKSTCGETASSLAQDVVEVIKLRLIQRREEKQGNAFTKNNAQSKIVVTPLWKGYETSCFRTSDNLQLLQVMPLLGTFHGKDLTALHKWRSAS